MIINANEDKDFDNSGQTFAFVIKFDII